MRISPSSTVSRGTGARPGQGDDRRDRLVGFCLLITREVIGAIGMLDEQFGIGSFEDDDYCLRAIAAGYRAVIAGDAFVHHFGSRTFLGAESTAVQAPASRTKRAFWESGPATTTARPFTRPTTADLRPSADLSRAGRGGRRWPPASDPARSQSTSRRGRRPAAAAGSAAAEALALHDRARQCQNTSGPASRASGHGSTR